MNSLSSVIYNTIYPSVKEMKMLYQFVWWQAHKVPWDWNYYCKEVAPSVCCGSGDELSEMFDSSLESLHT
jgi:hypothetical protein